VIVKVGLARG